MGRQPPYKNEEEMHFKNNKGYNRVKEFDPTEDSAVPVISLRESIGWSHEDISRANKQDLEIAPVFAWLVKSISPPYKSVKRLSVMTKNIWTYFKDLFFENNMLYLKQEVASQPGHMCHRLVTPDVMKNYILN